jgi:hypothetical protein
LFYKKKIWPSQQARAFITVNHFYLCLIVEGKEKSTLFEPLMGLNSKGLAPALFTIIKLEPLTVTNTLAYLVSFPVTKKKSFVLLTPGPMLLNFYHGNLLAVSGS